LAGTAAFRALLRKQVDHGQRKGGGFSGAGLGATEDVGAGKYVGDGLGLDGGGLGVSERLEGAQHTVAQAQFSKKHCKEGINTAQVRVRKTSRDGIPVAQGRDDTFRLRADLG
jgi:hypothetical protein